MGRKQYANGTTANDKRDTGGGREVKEKGAKEEKNRSSGHESPRRSGRGEGAG